MSELRNTTAPAGWYPDPHGLPQQRWWAGDQWTHAVAPSVQQPERAPQVTALPTPRETFALPATPSVQSDFPTRRQLREQAARQADVAGPHPAAPFEMPAAVSAVPEPVPAAVPVAAVVPVPIAAPTPVAVAAPVPAAPVALQPTIVPSPSYASTTLPAGAFPPPAAAAQVFVSPTPQPTPAQPSWQQPLAAQLAASPPPVAVAPTAFPPPSAVEPTFAPRLATPQPISSATPRAIAPAVSAGTQSSWPFQTPLGSGFDTPADLPYQPFGMKQSVRAGTSAPPDRVQTWAVWAMAILPLVMAGVGILVVTQLADFYTVFMQGGLLFIFALITIVLAVRDKRALFAYGHTRTASPAWVLLTPLVYLIVRSVKARGSAGRESAPLIAWLVCTALVVGAAFAFPDWVGRFITTTGLY